MFRVLHPFFNSLALEKKMINRSKSSEGQILWVEHETPRKRLRDLGLFSLKRRKLGRYLTVVFSCLMEEL